MVTLKEEDPDPRVAGLLKHDPLDRFAAARRQEPVGRFAPRADGHGWHVEVLDVAAADYRVLNVSRMGICLEGRKPLRLDTRYQMRLQGPEGEAVLNFYVVRSALCRDPSGESPVYQIAGLFNVLLERGDLPAPS